MRIALMTLAATMAFTTLPASAQPKDCPPGLAKKAVECVPPGLAKKGVRYDRGDVIDDDYTVIRNPARWDLDPNGVYYRVGDTFYEVDRETREVLRVIGALARLAD